MKKKILFLVLSIFIVVLILFSSSYALLFKTNVTDKQSYTTGILDITSEALNGSVTLNNELPMIDSDGENTTPYTFRITNIGNLSYKFNIMLLSTTTDNQIEAEYIKIKVNDNEIVTLNSLTNGIILSDITLKPDEYIDVTLRVWLDINTPNTQIGKTFNAKITTEGQAVYVESPAKKTLTMLGLTENTDTPDFSKTSCSDGCEESTVGIYEAEDDIGTSYYFRGDVENNYVYFAGFYWRIIRINGDGTVRMIYDGTSAHNNGEKSIDRIIGISAFNSLQNDNTYVGFMYGTLGASTYAETHANTNDSTIKAYLDTWYNENIRDTTNEQYIADAIYCNDRSLSSSTTGTGAGTSATNYGADYRLYDNNAPTLQCNQVNDRFTVNSAVSGVTGNSKLTNAIGLITADEVAYAGGKYSYSSSDIKYYLYTGNYYWTMSPDYFVEFADGFLVHSTGFLIVIDGVNSDGGVRPVISISGTALNSGTGTKTDPFKIDAAKNTLTQLGLTENTDTPDFSKTSCSDGCDEATVGIYKTADDIGTSYYFRGDVENNYVYFADKYWRIIRINGDGSIRIIYDGTSAHDNGESSTDRRTGKSVFDSSYNDNAYVGFMYGATGASTYAETHANTNDSTIKTVLDTWYTSNIKNTTNEQYVVDAIYCNDREVSTSDTNYIGNGSGTTKTSYKARERLETTKEPTLKCNQVNDRFTKSTTVNGVVGNGKLTNAIGLITADEVAYAGGVYITVNSKYYLYSGYEYWTMSPYNFDDTFADEFDVSNDLEFVSVNYSDSVRPVISLSSSALSSGKGTKTEPFTIGT